MFENKGGMSLRMRMGCGIEWRRVGMCNGEIRVQAGGWDKEWDPDVQRWQRWQRLFGH